MFTIYVLLAISFNFTIKLTDTHYLVTKIVQFVRIESVNKKPTTTTYKQKKNKAL